MALVKFGGGIVQMAGSIGGNTYARNRYGNYVRARTKPTNPNTTEQQIIRAALAQVTVIWSQQLTEAQRTAWNLYGSNVVMTNRLGESINLSGFNHFIRTNTILLAKAMQIKTQGPTVFEIPDADPTLTVTASEATQELTITFDNSLAWASETAAWLHFWQGKPQTGQRNFFAGPWKYIGSLQGNADPLPTTPLVAEGPFAIAEGQRQWVYCRITRADGRMSAPFRHNALVAA